MIGLVVLLTFFLTSIWPTFGLIAFMTISISKDLFAHYIPFLHGFVGYFYDVGFALAALIGVLIIIRRTHTENRKLVPSYVLFSMIFLAIWVWLRLPASREFHYGMSKALIFSIFDMLSIILGILFCRTNNEAKIVINSIIIVGIGVIVGLILFGRPDEAEETRITLGYTNVLNPADFAVYIIITPVCLWFSRKKAIFTKLTILIVPLALVSIILTGSRGPLVAIPIIILILCFIYRKTVKLKMPIYMLLTLFCTLIIIFFAGYKAPIQSRMSERAIKRGIDLRLILISTSIKGWLNSPIIGCGTGDFPVQIDPILPGYKYPHNLILEIANEFGIVGLIPFLFLLFGAFRAMKYFPIAFEHDEDSKHLFAPIFACFFYHFLMSFKTDSYAGSQMFYFFLGAVISYTELIKQKYLVSKQLEISNSSTERIKYDEEIHV